MKNNFTIYIFSECDLNGNLFVANHYALKDLNSLSSVHSSPSKSSQWTWECRSLGKIKKLEIMKIHQLMIAIFLDDLAMLSRKGSFRSQFALTLCDQNLSSSCRLIIIIIFFSTRTTGSLVTPGSHVLETLENTYLLFKFLINESMNDWTECI